ncbi:hypothetical protein EGW08_016644 [Elysia chlorotica]|uniref:G-protein coupled receptors family 1 profile domain-containing protein n=1 Tax=Elysia chlorotica TaxID=188477 RepID=A0A3S1B437_ELYCH|nr:hypothetical protein EGW08_016644 [Elysia chlorotica]
MEEVLTTIGSQDVQKSTVGIADTTPGFGCQDEDLFLPGSLRYILIVFGLVLMIENISMIVTIARHRKLRTNSNILVASLAFSDVLIGLLCFEMGLISEPGGVRSNIRLSEFAQRTFDTLGSGTNCGLIAISMVHLAALSVDRYLFLLWPLHYHHRVTQRRVAMAAAAIWTLGCGYTLLPIGLYAHPQYHTRCIIHNTPVEYEGAPLTCILVSCITVVSVCTFGIAKLAFGHSRKREIRNNGAVATDNDIVDGNKKATYLSRGNNGAIYTVNNIPKLSKEMVA